ncbi:hypothetical protein DBR06_SOUSAS1910054, partial [Sousa chinensis]
MTARNGPEAIAGSASMRAILLVYAIKFASVQFP